MSQSSRSYKVFLADDSALVRKKLRTLFSTFPGIEICGEAEDAEEAIAAIRTTAADAVVLDPSLRAGRGLDVLKAVKQLPSVPAVIVLTISPFSDLGRYYLEAGADHYFEKGHEFDGILALMESLSQRRGPSAD